MKTYNTKTKTIPIPTKKQINLPKIDNIVLFSYFHVIKDWKREVCRKWGAEYTHYFTTNPFKS